MILAAVSAVAASASAQTIALSIFDAPGATAGSFTDASGVNDAGVIVGFEDSTGSPRGFVRASNGKITSFTVPGAGFTVLGDINNNSQMTGQFGPANFSARHGFYTSGANVIPFDVPGMAYTLSRGINDEGQIVGDSIDANHVRRGFLRDANGHFTSLDIPGATAVFAFGINNKGQIVGEYRTGDPLNPVTHGYLRSPNGVFTSFDAPGFDANGAVAFTSANGINDLGMITGGTNGAGYVRDANGGYRSFETPDGYYNPTGFGINNLGLVVGAIDDDFTTHAFRATLVPEPGALALLMGMAGMGTLALRRKTGCGDKA